MVCTDTSDVERAVELLDRAVAVDPENSLAWTARGYALARLADRPDAAIESFTRALALDPADVTAAKNVGAMYAKQGTVDAAIETWNRIGKTGEDSPDVHYGLGEAFEQMGDMAAAEDHFKRVLAILGTNPMRNLARQGLSRIAQRRLR